MAYSLTTAVRGYYIYREFWMANLGEVLPCAREESNPHDPFAVSVHDGPNIVGQVPRKFSALCALFIQRGGTITCQVIGSKQYSLDLPQGGLEIPCVLTFSGEQREVLKVQKLVEEINAYITTNSDEQPNKGEKIYFSKVSPSKSAADKIKHLDRDTTGDLDCKASSSDIDLDCNVVTVEDSTEQFTRNISEDLEWIRISSIILKKSDKESIIDGRRLTDMHINAAQKILSQQFPSFSGFDSTLKQRCIGKWIDNYIQILFCRGCHWITVSTVGCKEGDINIFDSLYCEVDVASKKAIADVYPSSDISFNVPNMPMQLGVDDCGLYAIAFATALAVNYDPATLYAKKFKQNEMRTHLISCLQNNYFIDFP